jgi:putative transposase
VKRSKFSEEQVVMALRQHDAGTTEEEICRKLGVSEQAFYRWKRKYGQLGTPEVRELRQLRDENRKLKQLVADVSLARTILQDALRNKW